MVAIAAQILFLIVHQAKRGMTNGIWDMRYAGNTSRMALWSTSISIQAQSAHANSLIGPHGVATAGPCTDMLLYEQAVLTALNGTSGICFSSGTASAGCRLKNYHTGLEDRFGVEITEVFSLLKRGEANELVKNLLPKYEEKLSKPPDGKSFPECYDVQELQPSEEWKQIYERVKREIRNRH